jgi:hypothetical protein
MQMSETVLLRSILYQLLDTHRVLIPRLFLERWEVYSLFSDDSYLWSLQELRLAFSRLQQEDSTNIKFCIFIDGLDEFYGDHSELKALLKKISSSSHIEVCVSSRPWNVFEHEFDAKSCFMLQDLTYQDIKFFVESKFQGNAGFAQLEIMEPVYADRLKEHVTVKAEEVFLWVFLVVQSLLAGLVNGDRICDLERRLDLLPSDLSDLYNKMLQSLDPFYLAHASQLFQMTRASSSPLSLLTFSFADEEAELVFKCQVRSLTTREESLRADIMRRRLNSCCKVCLKFLEQSVIRRVQDRKTLIQNPLSSRMTTGKSKSRPQTWRPQQYNIYIERLKIF